MLVIFGAPRHVGRMNDMTPILIGAGQAVEPVPADLSKAASHADMAGRAAKAVLTDAGISAEHIDVVACVRTFSDSSPAYACPFGGPDKFPLAVASRIGATPKRAIYDVLGGQSPQALVGEFAQELIAGRADVVVIAGGEALANMRAAQRSGAELDWSEKHAGEWEDRGLFSGPMIVSQSELAHGLMDAMSYYGFIETARRIKAGRTVAEHRQYMAELIAPFSDVAATNPYSMFDETYSAEAIATETSDNRALTTPFLKSMVAKDGVNQGAAIIMTTVGRARELGVPETQWVYLRGHAEGQEKLMLDRTELGRSVAMDVIIEAALSAANVAPQQIEYADIYSCFPCVVDQAATALDRKGKPMTLTGGLPFFGGPGNNYTLHGICEVVNACRNMPGSLGLAHGNGGWMSKQAVGVYSTDAVEGDVFPDRDLIAKKIDEQLSPGQVEQVSGEAVIETYIVNHKRGVPIGAVVVGQIKTGERFYAKLQDMTADQLLDMADGKYDGTKIRVEAGMPANKAWSIG